MNPEGQEATFVDRLDQEEEYYVLT